MASRTLPGLGLNAFWNLGEDNWKTGMDSNLTVLSALCQGAVISRVATEPGTPTNGDMHLMTAGLYEKSIAIRDNGAWVYIAPKTGCRIYVTAESDFYFYNGTIWLKERALLSDSAILATYTAVNQPSVDIVSVITSEFNSYEIEFNDIVLSVDGSNLNVVTSSNNGSTWDNAAANYRYATHYGPDNGGAGSASGSQSASVMTLVAAVGASTNEDISGILNLYAANSSRYKKFTWELSYITGAGNGYIANGAGRRLAVAAVNALRVGPSTGLIVSGTIKIRGKR